MNILHVLMFYKEATFGQLRPKDFPTEHFTYHLKTLTKNGILETTNKNAKKYYKPTMEGKQLMSRIETENNQVVQQGKRGVVVRCWKKVSKVKKYLVCKREKEPFFGYVGFHTGKIREGETVYNAAMREFKEETGLSADIKLEQIRHFIDYSTKNDFIRDIYFYSFGAKNPKGKLIKRPEGEGVLNFWATKKELKESKDDFFPDFWGRDSMWNLKSPFFVEKIRTIKGY